MVSMTMTPEGAREWAIVTRNNLKKPVAIVLDGVVYSAPVIEMKSTVVSHKSAVISLLNNPRLGERAQEW